MPCSIIFSQWTTTLNLVGQYLQGRDISYGRIDGTDDFKVRQDTLDRFKREDNFKVLLMTTGVGAFGSVLSMVLRPSTNARSAWISLQQIAYSFSSHNGIPVSNCKPLAAR